MQPLTSDKADPPVNTSSETSKLRTSSQRVSRRRFLKSMIGSVLAAPFLMGAYSRWVEPKWIRKRELTIATQRLPRAFQGMRIAHLSDLHFGNHVSEQEVDSLISRVMKAQPDMICFTGDLVEDHKVSGKAIIPYLKKLRAPFGQYAVLGNHDYRRATDLATEVLTEAGIDVLTNKARIINHNGSSMAIAGIDDALDGTPEMGSAIASVPDEMWTLLLAHEPDWADYTVSSHVDMQLSGHSHGGQIRAPFYGPIFLPEMGKRYPDGLYTLPREHDHPLLVHTSRGLGTTLLPMRLFCPPEWTIITLQSEI
ncbi:metallophosphoesterase [Paenibacillus taiwanensis]|uniref:metallophosphoesterase n=1 Tax=Paenibacillus taiwanensis TaxID=401638 RepID=UPI001FE1B215|nr:metallophosphoesterase [Paenibacillus taiwanensis]